MNVLTVHGPHPRMLAVLLASDDPRTSWSFNWKRGWFLFTGATQQQVERSNLDVCVLPTLNCKRVVMVQPGG